MNRPTYAHLSAVGLSLWSALAFAQECPRPNVRATTALQTAIDQDVAMATAFDAAATACTTENLACDEQRTRCGSTLTQTLQKQISFDEGAYLRDMLIAYQGQQYRMVTAIPSAPPLTDVSCNADSPSLKAAAVRRLQQAERRRLMIVEYPRWIGWVNSQYKMCTDRVLADKTRADAAAADAAKLLLAAEAAKKAGELRQDQALAADKLAREKAAAEAKAKQDAQLAAQAALVEAARAKAAAEKAALEKEEAAKRALADKAEAERRARETAEERAAREKQEAAEAQIVADREAKKLSQIARQNELIEKEKMRSEDIQIRHENARKAAETAHLKKVEELRHSLALSEAEKATQLAEVDKQYEQAETLRRERALKEIDSAGQIDRSDERLGGALSGHGAAGYYTFSGDGSASDPLIGGQVTARIGFWGVAPATGMASGVELRATGLFLSSVDGAANLIHVSPEFRYWFGFFGLGVAFEYQYLKTTPKLGGVIGEGRVNPNPLGLGPTISLAAVDNPNARVIFSVRWMPILSNQLERITGEIEGGYDIFSFGVQGGVIKDSTLNLTRTGVFVGISIGLRFRW